MAFTLRPARCRLLGPSLPGGTGEVQEAQTTMQRSKNSLWSVPVTSRDTLHFLSLCV